MNDVCAVGAERAIGVIGQGKLRNAGVAAKEGGEPGEHALHGAPAAGEEARFRVGRGDLADEGVDAGDDVGRGAIVPLAQGVDGALFG